MNTSVKHYKFINSKTGNVIFYQSLDAALGPNELRDELRKIQEQVATQNGLNVSTIYWEEVAEADR